MPTFTTASPVTVVLDINSIANVNLTAADRTDTVVEVAPTTASKALDVEHAENTVVEYANGEVRITTPRPPKMSARSRSVDITIQVPTGSSVRGTAPCGDLRTQGQLAGCDYTVQSGTVTVDKLSATSTLDLASGDIRIAEVRSGSVKATTKSGNVRIGVSKDSGCRLVTQTMHGSVSNSLSDAHDGRAVTESVELEIRVMSGDIDVHRSEA